MTKPRVLLLGDSMRMGYQEDLRRELAPVAETLFSPENGRDTTFTLWQANQLLHEYGDVDVIHWNNGYWDMNPEPPMLERLHPLPEYRYFLTRLAEFLGQHTKHLVFATTLPVRYTGHAADNTGIDIDITYDDAVVRAYNAAALPIMQTHGVAINDLYHFALQDPNYFKGPDRLHLSAEGNRRVAAHTAAFLRQYL
ncbi:hypothetical protein [Lacticaseibacillus parakribbianus]|uniref:hypothetical protein n=1 Tax=Lacticaseibacillus parakribbianus TaxID=2970927 RepID=UPI0021CB901C|nr:hypothetical protein [Lacticaseibacillus parakribbianus]